MNSNSPYSLIHSAANRAAGSLLSLADIAYKADCGQADDFEIAEAFHDASAAFSFFRIPLGNQRIYPGPGSRNLANTMESFGGMIGDETELFGDGNGLLPFAHRLINNINSDAENWLDPDIDIDEFSGEAFADFPAGSNGEKHFIGWDVRESAPLFYYEFDFADSEMAFEAFTLFRFAGWIIEPADAPLSDKGLIPPAIKAPAFKPRPGGFLFNDRLSRIA
jgi:hypothetical protein